jgi:hypothetical protein
VVLRSAFLDRLANNPALGTTALAVTVLFLATIAWSWRRLDGETRQLLIMIFVTSESFIGFLAFSYISVFAPDEAARAASLWRYTSELGGLLLLGIAAGLSQVRWPARAIEWPPSAWAPTLVGLCAAAVALPLLLASRYRPDCSYADVMATRRAADELRAYADDKRDVVVLATSEPDWRALAWGYEWHLPIDHVRGLLTNATDALGALYGKGAFPSDALVVDARADERSTLRTTSQLPAVAIYRARPLTDASGPLRFETIARTEPATVHSTCDIYNR